MISAYDKTGDRHLSWCPYHSGPWYCPECGEEVQLDGDVFIHNVDLCKLNVNISSVHDELKRDYFLHLYNREDVEVVEVEYKIGNRRTDVYFEANGHKVAIEIQKRHQKIETMMERTMDINEKDVAVMWIYPVDGKYDGEERRITALEKYIEELMNGSIFYRFTGLKVSEFSLKEVKKYDKHVRRDVIHPTIRIPKHVAFKNIVDDCSVQITESGLMLWR